MERNSLLYKLRRKCQILAHKFISDEAMSKFYYWIVLHKKLNLNHPQTFNEKIQWMKLYYYPKNPLVIKCIDKVKVREYVKEVGFQDHLVPFLGIWDKAEEIEWKLLPKEFILKCNHGCAYNIVVHNKNDVDRSEIQKQLNSWLKEDFGAFNIELHYSQVKEHKIVCEKFLGDKLIDYKFFCFNGKPLYFYVSKDLLHDRQCELGFFNIDGSPLELYRDDYKFIGSVKHPSFFNEMVNAAKIFSKEFPFVRVDFFIGDNTWYFAELTFTPGAGMMPFNPEKFDFEWGKMIDLPRRYNFGQQL